MSSRSISIRPKGGKYILTLTDGNSTRHYRYASFANAYKKAILCDFMDLEESTVKKLEE